MANDTNKDILWFFWPIFHPLLHIYQENCSISVQKICVFILQLLHSGVFLKRIKSNLFFKTFFQISSTNAVSITPFLHNLIPIIINQSASQQKTCKSSVSNVNHQSLMSQHLKLGLYFVGRITKYTNCKKFTSFQRRHLQLFIQNRTTIWNKN